MAQDANSPFRDVVRHTLVYGSGYVTMALVSFVLVPVYTRHLSPSGYGLLGLMLVLYGLMSTAYDLGFTNSVGRFFFDRAETGEGPSLLEMRATAVMFLALLGGLLTLLLWIPAHAWSRLLTQSPNHAGLVRIVAFTLYAEGVAIVPLTLIRMQERSRQFVLITITRFVVTLGLSMLFVVALGLGVRGALLANAASAIGVLLILLPDFWTVLKVRPSWPLLREMLAFGVPFFPVLLSGWFIEASDRYLLGVFRSHAEVGYYVLGYKVAQMMQIAVAAFSMGWAPLLYRIYARPDAPAVYRRLTTYYTVVAGLVAVAVGVSARPIVAIVAPANYAPAAKIVPLIAFGYALYGLYILMVTGMGVAKKTAPMAWIVAGAAAANLGINIVLIPAWGMEAAAVTTVLADGVMVVGVWYYSQKVYPVPYDWRRIIATTVIGAAIVAVTDVAGPRAGLAGFGVAIGACVLFLAALIKARVVSHEDVAQARALLRGLRRSRSRRMPGERVAS